MHAVGKVFVLGNIAVYGEVQVDDLQVFQELFRAALN